MSEDPDDNIFKTEFTGIFDSPKIPELKKNEQIDEFESMEQLAIPVQNSQTAAPPESLIVPHDSLEEIKNYSEQTRETPFIHHQKYYFNLSIKGSFDPYSRSKLLLFITDNPVGLNSSELDTQISGERVLLPRISEYAGIRLIQTLRDSGLSFNLVPASRDPEEIHPPEKGLSLEYALVKKEDTDPVLPTFLEGTIDTALWEAYDSIKLVQFLKAEILEVERSELFQELLDRMTLSLKKKARVRGAAAIGNLSHNLKSLRLPSQYQIEVTATLLKKRR